MEGQAKAHQEEGAFCLKQKEDTGKIPKRREVLWLHGAQLTPWALFEKPGRSKEAVPCEWRSSKCPQVGHSKAEMGTSEIKTQ